MKTKKNLLSIIILLSIIMIIFVILIFLKDSKEKSISLEVVLPSEATIIYDPILGDKLKLDIGRSATIKPLYIGINKNDTKYIIEDESIVSIDNNIIKALKKGNTKVYIANLINDIKSNIINIEVGDPSE